MFQKIIALFRAREVTGLIKVGEFVPYVAHTYMVRVRGPANITFDYDRMMKYTATELVAVMRGDMEAKD